MDKISQLLQEAKPLYIQRKRNREIIKKCMVFFIPIIFCVLAIFPFSMNNDDEKSFYTSSTSIVERMGLPTDDYGLLKVD